MPDLPRLRPRLLVGATVLTVLGLCASGCGDGGGAGVTARTLHVTERDFAILAPTHVRAGLVDLRVQNRGPDAHELIVARVPGTRVPLRSDGLTVNEERLLKSTVGALEPARSGVARDLQVRLRPGRYVLFCNMAGHFLAGMQHVLEVS